MWGSGLPALKQNIFPLWFCQKRKSFCKCFKARKENSMEKLLTVHEISNFLGVKPSTVRKWVHLGFIPHVKLGRAVRFEKRKIEDWVSDLSQEGRPNRTPFLDL